MGHVASENFGIRLRQAEDGMAVINDYAFVEHAFKTLPAFTGEEARVAMDLAFDLFYGLQRMDQAARRPLMSIAVSPLEDYGVHGPLHKALEIYAKSSVAEFFPSLGIHDFMDLSREVRDYVLSISESMKLQRYQEQQAALAQAGLGPKGLPNMNQLGKLPGQR